MQMFLQKNICSVPFVHKQGAPVVRPWVVRGSPVGRRGSSLFWGKISFWRQKNHENML